MANADFSREQNQTPGGFDSGSYREAKRPDTEAVRLTPLQQKLSGLEKALPAALAKQGTALVLSVVVMLAAFVGFGGAKVRGKYNEARQWFTMHAVYQDNTALGAAIDQLYAKLQEQAADPMKMGAVQGQYGQFNSAGTIIGNLQYNDAVYEYQNDVGGFPASMLGRLFGVQEVEPFA